MENPQNIPEEATFGRVADAPSCSIPEHHYTSQEPFGMSVSGERGGIIWLATVAVQDDSGRVITAQTDFMGFAAFPEWPRKATNVVISKDGYMSVTNDLSQNSRFNTTLEKIRP